MGAKKTDISQIRKYLNGELDAHAMHQLEREAQDDPFLMDALDGYEAATGLQQRQLNDLDSRLQQRISQQKVRSLIPWKYYAAAASVLIVFTLGYLLWPAGHAPFNNEKQVIAVKIAPPDNAVTLPDTLLKPADKNTLIAAVTPPAPKTPRAQLKQAAPVTITSANADAAIRIDEPVGNSDTKAVVEDIAAITQKPAVNMRSLAKTKPDSAMLTNYSMTVRGRVSDTNNLREVTIPGLAALSKKDANYSKTGLATQTLQGKVTGAQVTTPKKVSGTILNELGLPLSGVNVVVDGTRKITQTDAQGHFSIPAEGQATLDIRSIGYQSKRVKANGDSLKIALNPDTKSLAEVVIVGYDTKKVKAIKEAHPQMGWDNYNNYLKRTAIATETGTVQLTFTVGAKGELSNFHVSKGLSDATNNKAIEIVKNGPVWNADVSGRAKTVKLKMEFSKE